MSYSINIFLESLGPNAKKKEKKVLFSFLTFLRFYFYINVNLFYITFSNFKILYNFTFMYLIYDEINVM